MAQNGSKVKSIPYLFLVLSANCAAMFAQSKAHNLSRYARVDPAYHSLEKYPESKQDSGKATWIYGPAELESWRLQLLIQRKDSARLRVGYPGVFHRAFTRGTFLFEPGFSVNLDSIRFRAVGAGSWHINDSIAGSFDYSDDRHTVRFKKTLPVETLSFQLNTENEPVSLLIEDEPISTLETGWKWKSDTQEWESAYHHPQNLESIPPHKLEDPTIQLRPEEFRKDLFDFGREVYGYILVRTEDEPVLNSGESEKEALDSTNTIREQSLELVRDGNLWRTKYPVAFRYVHAPGIGIENITCEAIYHPVAYRGAFACSDSTLTQIWMNSAYTVRLNMHDFLLDGIKRDRLPWTGDLAMSLWVNAFAFADAELVRRSLVALGRAGISEKDINGIIDYSLWWVIAQDHYQLYFKDATHLNYEWERIKAVLNELDGRSDVDGFLVADDDTWLFIDWVDQEKWTALQILWWWAQESAARLAERMDDGVTAGRWKESAKRLRENLTRQTWSEAKGYWRSGKNPGAKVTRHPNFLAVVSGLSDMPQPSGILEVLDNDSVLPVGTPYMAGFEALALSRVGDIGLMLDRIRDYWGGMLEKGATTFWEAYDPEETYENQYAFYNRPYAKSLCHAWSAGPAAILPSEIFGLRPLEDGWKRFAVNPDLGDLQWASVSLPTSSGNITIDVVGKEMLVVIPAGVSMVWMGEDIPGPLELHAVLPDSP